MRFDMHLAAINKKSLCIYYHLNCRYFNDNAGDIKPCVMLISQNTFYTCLYINYHHTDANRRDLTCIWLQSIKSAHVSIITSIVGILMTMHVILTLV